MRAGEVESHREARERITAAGDRLRGALAPLLAACEDQARTLYRVPTAPTGRLVWTTVPPSGGGLGFVVIPTEAWAALRDALAVRP